jgi:uncharacterized membrane protein
MSDITVARAIHVLAVVLWIGGVSMVTTVVLPAARRGALGERPLEAFAAIERRFSWQARMAVIAVGLSGLYMLWRGDLWSRFGAGSFWWMHAMVGLWLVFAVILFVIEPLVSSRANAKARGDPARALKVMQRLHQGLLGLSAATVLVAVAGAHGW